jgi:hypothetical protein
VRIYEQTGHDLDFIAPPLMGGQDYAFNFHYSLFNEPALTNLLLGDNFSCVKTWNPKTCDHHEFEDWASRDIHYRDLTFPISLNLEATRNTP